MDEENKVEVGDVFLLDGKVNKVFKLAKKKNQDGEEVEFVFFKPCFEKNSWGAVEYSIPLANFGMLRQRKVVSKAEIKKLFDELSERLVKDEALDMDELEGVAGRNDIGDKVELIRKLWKEKGNKDKNFSYSKSVMLSNVMGDVCQEAAAVLEISYEAAQKKLEARLAKARKGD